MRRDKVVSISAVRTDPSLALDELTVCRSADAGTGNASANKNGEL